MEGQVIINVQVHRLNFVCSMHAMEVHYAEWLLIHLGTEGSDCGFFAIANAVGNLWYSTDEKVPGWMFDRQDDKALPFIAKNWIEH